MERKAATPAGIASAASAYFLSRLRGASTQQASKLCWQRKKQKFPEETEAMPAVSARLERNKITIFTKRAKQKDHVLFCWSRCPALHKFVSSSRTKSA
ncbi:hypothetical protein CR205_07310 [Alteribacter lacisalsi]|uniref:Uncharacterized protein n=1 Tax=Alteribacter lacisalsi TaxID=2045244 RepID=A0A2W0H979_9BACI|nr:hypothetical protein CR205_07310 [Alteribacter lacisalsi]